MPTIEQVSKQVFSDNNWLKKCAIGAVLCLVPFVNIIAFGYLYQIFLQGRTAKAMVLPEWVDFKSLFMDGLRFLVVGLIFAGLPIALIAVCSMTAFDDRLALLPMIPVVLIAGPLMSAALYLYTVRLELRDSFSLEALSVMLKKTAISYVVPTLAYLGLCLIIVSPLGLVLLPIPFFFGGVFYFYVMGFTFKSLEQRARR